ncbi:MAG: putative RDD family membrane protein YckC [Cryomorphaceae bacterium]|jgi:uncharacterized RDD family membrane protein YckC
MQTPGFLKRIVIAAYDGLLLFAVIFFLSAILMGLFQWLAPSSFYLDPSLLDNPKMVELSPLGRSVGTFIVSVNCLTISFLFYGWFWTHGGQTLGMRAWNLYLIKPDGKFIDWKIASKRYSAALLSWAALGLGFTWILLDKRKLAWHDILSNTRIVYVPPEPK